MPLNQTSVEDSAPEARSPAAKPEAEAVAGLRLSVLLFAIFIAALILLSAYFTDRNGWIDEIGLLNPPYMLAHFGKLSYPIYGFDHSTIVHPPIHTGVIGWLARWGFTWYYAEATPTAFFFLLTVIVIVRGRFPVPVQLGLLYSIGFLVSLPYLLFGTRPEGHLQAAWFAGLVLLEAGRLDAWNRGMLFAGAFVLTWGCAVHYYGIGGLLGLIVYAAFAVVALGWRGARRQIIALACGACLFGIPYLAFYIIPNFHDIISFIGLTEANNGVVASIKLHELTYAGWTHWTALPGWVRVAAMTRIPLLVFSTAILAAIPATRGLALAALPFELFMFLLAAHKLESYYIHELSIFAVAVCCGVSVLADRLCRRVPFKFVKAAAMPVFAAVLAVYLCAGNPLLKAATVTLKPRVHEADVARAAALKILGPHATVGGRLCLWYASGTSDWYDVSSDLLWYPKLRFDPKEYFKNFDAIAEDQHMSNSTANSQRATLGSWYSDGTLKLRGFFFGEANVELQILLLSAQAPPQVIGYGLRNGELYRFEQYTGGDYEVVSAVCPKGAGEELKKKASFSAILFLPEASPTAPPSSLLLTVLDSKRGSGLIPNLERSCRIVNRVPGSLFLDDKDKLIAWFRKTDTPMRFDRELKNLPTYVGAGVLKP